MCGEVAHKHMKGIQMLGGANIHCTISYIKQAILDTQVKGRRLGGSPLWLACPSSFVQ